MAKKSGLDFGGIGAGIGALAGIFGIGEGRQDRRQVRQARELSGIQVKGAKELSEFQKGQDLEMWKNTSYPAQMEMMKEAGLNPSLMYGMGGGGGTTTGSGGGGMPSAGSASDSASAQQASMGMGMQLAQLSLMNAQKDNIKADTEVKQAEAGKAGSQQGLNEQQLSEQVESRTARMQSISYGAQEQIAKTKEAFNRGEIAQATQQDTIKRIKEEAIGAGIENLVMKQGINLSKAQIQQIGQNILQGWKGLDIQQQNATTNKRMANVAELTQLVNESLGRANVSQKIHELDQRQMEALQKLATDIVGLGTGQGATSTSEWGENGGGEWYRETRTKKH